MVFSSILNKFGITGRDALFLAVERLLTLVFGFGVSIATIRHLGPDQFGLLAYVSSIVSVAAPFVGLGISGPLIKEFVGHPNRSGSVIKLTIRLRGLIGVASAVLAIFMFYYLKNTRTNLNDSDVFMVGAVLSLQYIAAGFDVFDSYCQANLKIKKLVFARCSTLVLFSLLRVFAILSEGGVVVFAWLISAQALFGGFILYLASGRAWRDEVSPFPAKEKKRMFISGSFVLVASVVNALQSRVEVFYLEKFFDLGAVGEYSAALRIVELLDSIGIVVITLYLPKLLKDTSEIGVEKGAILTRSFKLAIVCYLFSLPALLLLAFLSAFMYGDKFEHVEIIIIAMFSRPLFTFFGLVRNATMLADGRLQYGLVCSCVGLVVALGAGLIFVPYFGVYGAVLTAFLSYLSSNFLIDFVVNREYARSILASMRYK